MTSEISDKPSSKTKHLSLVSDELNESGFTSSFTAPATLVRTLALTHFSLNEKELRSYQHVNVAWFSKRSKKNKKKKMMMSVAACESVKDGIDYPVSAASSVYGYPYTRLLPCPLQNGPPRIEHLVVSEGGGGGGGGGCSRIYMQESRSSCSVCCRSYPLWGCVLCACMSKTPSNCDPRVYKEVTAPSVLKQRVSIKGKTVREAQKTFRITDADQFVEDGTYLRVHVHPKRFPRCYDIDWKSRVIAVTEDFVVLDKPAGTTVGGTTDNIKESCATFTSRALGLSTPLMTTHQIDNCTEGCVVLARSKEYCSVFHGKIREKKVKKLYLALAAAPVPLGTITHYMRPINMAPRLISEDSIERWSMCQLEVMKCKEVPWPSSAIEDEYGVEDCGWPSKDHARECKINLLTEKTHQIRAQLAAYGAPLVGDPELNPFGKHTKHYANEHDKEIAVTEWMAQHGKEPNVVIGLQACQISWDDGKHSFEASDPWWRHG